MNITSLGALYKFITTGMPLVSKRVTFDGTEWIREELEHWGDGSAQDLAEHICDSARRRYANNRPDDITVLAAIIEARVVFPVPEGP